MTFYFADVKDLNVIINLLKRFGFSETKWYELGLRLGLLKTTLDSIEHNFPDAFRCLSECLDKWLRKADNVGEGNNWYSLSASLWSMNEISVSEKLDHESKLYAK